MTDSDVPELHTDGDGDGDGDGELRPEREAMLGGIDTSWMKGLDAGAFLGGIDTSWMKGLDAGAFLGGIDTSWMKGLDAGAFLGGIDTSWMKGVADFVGGRFPGLPPNWSGVSATVHFDEDELRSIILVEGIPLAWVPSAALIDRLLTAEHAKARREQIRNGWRGILRDCERAVGELPSRQARSHARFVSMSASAIRDGHYEAAQALAANLVDTLGRSFIKAQTVGYNWSLVTSKNQRPKLSKLALRAVMVLGPLAAGHADYHPGDAIPRAFSRHATAHGVSPRQYTRVNSLFALMNATALLCWLERDSDVFSAK
ncbi:hypothetical protein ACFVR6_07400 [Microbacterium sp. NPDC058021]|uniref:hypothetical protein n=1 Tax=Microbacterium sp. NPDC058021 TaxID=3346306 RepID=UPI0036D8BFAB